MAHSEAVETEAAVNSCAPAVAEGDALCGGLGGPRGCLDDAAGGGRRGGVWDGPCSGGDGAGIEVGSLDRGPGEERRAVTWFKIDDSFYRHRKVRRLGRYRVQAVGVWALCGGWSGDNLTDGFIPWEVVEEWDPNRRMAERLIAAELWFEAERDGESGCQFHDWSDWQPTRDQVIQRRKADAERRARWREKRWGHAVTPDEHEDKSQQESRRDPNRESQHESRRESRSGSRVGSALPDPTRKEKKESPDGDSSSETAAPPSDQHSEPDPDPDVSEPPRDDVNALCHRLRDWMIKNGAKPPTITKQWRTQARLMLDVDKRELAKALKLIDWCQQDPFWMTNIHSMSKFRKQYDKLAMRANEEYRRNNQHAKANADAVDPNKNPWVGVKYI